MSIVQCRSLTHTCNMHTNLDVGIEAGNQEGTHYECSCDRPNLHHGSNSYSMGWASKAGKLYCTVNTRMVTVAQGTVAFARCVSSTK